MGMSFNNEKIKKYSSILADEYKELLIKETILRSENDNDVSVRVLLDIDTEAKRTIVITSSKMEKRRKLIAITGLIYVLVGFFTLLLYYMKKSGALYEEDGTVLLISLVVSLVGILVMMFSAVLKIYNDFENGLLRSKREKSRVLAYSVIEKWRELESIVSELSEKNTFVAPKSVIRFLQENDLIDSKEEYELRMFLKIRNDIVHFSEKNISNSDVLNSIKEIEKIISKLEKIL